MSSARRSKIAVNCRRVSTLNSLRSRLDERKLHPRSKGEEKRNECKNEGNSLLASFHSTCDEITAREEEEENDRSFVPFHFYHRPPPPPPPPPLSFRRDASMLAEMQLFWRRRPSREGRALKSSSFQLSTGRMSGSVLPPSVLESAIALRRLFWLPGFVTGNPAIENVDARSANHMSPSHRIRENLIYPPSRPIVVHFVSISLAGHACVGHLDVVPGRVLVHDGAHGHEAGVPAHTPSAPGPRRRRRRRELGRGLRLGLRGADGARLQLLQSGDGVWVT